MPEQLPLLSEQEDRLRYGAWTEEHGLGEFVRTFGVGYRITGPLDASALAAALDGVIARHDALRAVFPDGLHSTYQVVSPPRETGLRLTDLRGRAAPVPLAEGCRIAGEELSANFDLTSGVLLRGVLIQLGDDEHVLGLGADHLVADGEAFEVIVDELWRRYEALAGGRPLDLPEPDFRYPQYLRWEADWLAQPEQRAAIEDTRTLVAGLGLSPAIRLDGMMRATNGSYAVGAVSRRLAAGVAERLLTTCRESRTTAFNALIAAFGCALHSCGAATDVGMMIPTSRRIDEHLLSGVCMLSTYATTRVTLDPAMPFRDLTRQARGTVLRAHRLGQLPAREIMKTLAPDLLDRLFLRPSVFFDAAPSGWAGESRKVGALVIEPAPMPITLRHIENVSMFATVGSGEVSFTAFYPADVFDMAVMDRLADRYVEIIDASARDPLQPVSELVG